MSEKDQEQEKTKFDSGDDVVHPPLGFAVLVLAKDNVPERGENPRDDWVGKPSWGGGDFRGGR